MLLRVYRVAIRLYPRAFRDEYGDDLVQAVRDELHQDRVPTVVARTVIDLALSIPTQHLEAHMRSSRRLVALVYAVIAFAGLSLAVLGGSNAVTLVLGLATAASAGTIAIAGWQRGATSADAGVTAGWWKFLLAGPILIGAVILAAGVGVNAWMLGLATVVAALGSMVLGLGLGIARLAQQPRLNR